MFDIPLTEIPGRLSFGPRPRSAAEVAGIDLVVNLLTDGEMHELGMDWLSSRRLPIRDRECPPNRVLFDLVLEEAEACLRGGGRVHIHCRAGIGRAGLVSACLVSRLDGGAHLWERLSRARGVDCPDTEEQKAWVEDYRRFQGGVASFDEALRRLQA